MEQYGETKKRRKLEAGDQPKEKKVKKKQFRYAHFSSRKTSLTKKD